MILRSDSQLLLSYAERRSEADFAELVRRHLNLVHAAALRITRDPDLAKDVSQAVFVALANQAGKLAGHAVLAGWLHRTTRNIAAQCIRGETRRRAREQAAAIMHEPSGDDADWQQIAPQLDAVLADLPAADRDAILLRYFENKTASEMANLLGISSQAAQKRVNRAVERLRSGLGKRGLPVGAAGLAGAISANAVPTAPVGLAATFTAASHAGATVSSAAAATKITAMTTLQKTLVAAAAIALAGTAISQLQRHSSSAEEVPTPSSLSHAERKPREEKSAAEKLARSRPGKSSIDRQKELARLKLQWMELKPKGNYGVAEQQALAKDSAGLLLCSREAVELLLFLKENELWGEGALNSEIANLFDSPRAAKARQLLVELPETANVMYEGAPGPGGEGYRDWWSRAAGKTCPEDEFESFRAALNCKSCATEALYGRNERRLNSAPQAAFTSSLEAYRSGIPTLSGRSGVTVLFDVKAEQVAKIDFQKWEEQLPPDVQEDEPRPPHLDEDAFTGFRRNLFWNWAKIDPAAAANHVMANPDRLAPRLMEEIVGGYSGHKDRKEVIAWVATFPEGPYFDAAAKGAASYARGTPGIDELIQKIQDPKMREEAAKSAQMPLVNPNTR